MKQLALLVILLPTIAFAQQPQTLPEIQSLQTRLMFEINTGLQCSTENISLSRQVTALQAELAALKKPLPDVPNPAPTEKDK